MKTITLEEQLAHEAEHMVSLTRRKTGITNTLFVSPKGYARHAARLKIAIDPPDTFSTATEGATMALHAGKHMSASLTKQVERFIKLNRAVLMEYWNEKISTEELLDRIKPI
jgi:hypothetical protein